MCAGCLALPGSSQAASFQCSAGAWSPCTATCGGGTQTRAVDCVQSLLGAATTSVVAASSCAELGVAAPAASRSCSTQSCALGACPAACTDLQRGDGFCDAVCNVAACAFDAGDCTSASNPANALLNNAANVCGAATDCATCLLARSTVCGWCSSTGKCAAGDASGPADAASCPAASWSSTSCLAPESRLSVTYPTSGALLKAGNSYALTWTGAAPTRGSVKLLLRTDGGAKMFSGYGIPADAIGNTGTFNWLVPGGTPTSTLYQLLVSSTTDPTNFALTGGHFSVDGNLPDFYWEASAWSACTVVCGGGTHTRTVSCTRKADLAKVSASFCNAARQPSLSEACNTHTCAQCDLCQCLPKPSGSLRRGYFCGKSVGGVTYGCAFVTTPAALTDQDCCLQQARGGRGAHRRECLHPRAHPHSSPTLLATPPRPPLLPPLFSQGKYCDDGCTSPTPTMTPSVQKATWQMTSASACSVPCGGGTRYQTYTCRG